MAQVLCRANTNLIEGVVMGGANRDKINGILGELSKGRGKFKEDEFNAEELVETFTEKEKEAEKTGKPKMGMDNPEER